MNKVIVAIISITILEGLAIWQGINGAGLAGAIGAITGLGGFALGKHTKPK